MSPVTSEDGTSIAYQRMGSGPAVILVGGALDDGSENAPLVPELAERFTVLNYARRGRADSGDTPPYAVEREIEDIEALIAEAGGSAHLYGVSSGGALALEATAAGLAVNRLAVYDVPYNVAGDWPARWAEYRRRLGELLAEDRRGDALELFMRLAETPEPAIASARTAPFWPAMEAIAHTLAYDAACLGYGQPPTDGLATISQPVLVATGAHDPDAAEWVRALGPAADAIAASMPRAQRLTIEGQGHVADPKAVARCSSASTRSKPMTRTDVRVALAGVEPGESVREVPQSTAHEEPGAHPPGRRRARPRLARGRPAHPRSAGREAPSEVREGGRSLRRAGRDRAPARAVGGPSHLRPRPGDAGVSGSARRLPAALLLTQRRRPRSRRGLRSAALGGLGAT